MAGVVESEVFIQPDFDFVFVVDSDEFSVDVEGSETIVDLLEGVGGFPQHLQAFLEGGLGKFAEAVFYAFGIDVEFGGLSAFAEVGLVLGCLFFYSVDLVDFDEAEVVIFSEFIDFLFLFESVAVVQDDQPLFGEQAIFLALVEV